jgi:NADH-ubiquinone oxidoreductase chain 5
LEGLEPSIHPTQGEKENKMGGLASSFPFTYAMMLMGSLSLIGFPYLSSSNYE